MVNSSRSKRYTKMMIEIQNIIKKKDSEIEYRKCLQTAFDKTNEYLSHRNVVLGNQIKNLDNQIFLKNLLYDIVYNNNESLINEIENYKKSIDALTQENNHYKQLLKKKVKKSKIIIK